ncbi:Uncharacterized protein RNJ44_04333 [Nakaseomyces bracarensis]|uniref:USP domain-containing protein n=1 Tax=Nakaseomyces bracarensis TaxID=273131 RepID=A0ABR4NUL1_9SACH
MTTQENIKPLVDRILNNPVQFRRANVKMQNASDGDKSSYIVIGKHNHINNNHNRDDEPGEEQDENVHAEVKKRKIPSSVAEALNWYTKAALGEAQKKKRKGSDESIENEKPVVMENEAHPASDSSDSDVFHEASEYVEDITTITEPTTQSSDLLGEDLGEDIGEDLGEEIKLDNDPKDEVNTKVAADTPAVSVESGHVEEGNSTSNIETDTDKNPDKVKTGAEKQKRFPKGSIAKELLQLQRDNQDYEREQAMIREIRKAREEERLLAEKEGKKSENRKKRKADDAEVELAEKDNGDEKVLKPGKMEIDEAQENNLETKSNNVKKESEKVDGEKTGNEVHLSAKSVTPPAMIVDISDFYQLDEDFNDRGCIENSRIRKNWGAKYATKRPKGLLNHGVTCYTNAAVQALLHIPAVQHYLNDISRGKYPDITSNTISYILADTSKRIWGLDGKKSSYINPRKLITRLDDINCMMSEWQQEDSHEYFMSLMSRLQEDSVPKGHKMTESIIYDIFGGLLKQTVTCNSCGEISTTEQPFYDLSLHLKGKKMDDESNKESSGNSDTNESKSTRYSIEKSIKDFFNAELIRVDKEKKGYVCEKCYKTTNALKRNTILRAPETLLVHLKKFRFNGTSSSKMKQAVSYPMFLDLTEYCEYTGKMLPVKYQLLSVVVHEGRSLSSGHYIAHCRQPDGSWETYDDEYINKITERDVLKERNAYYVLYTRLTPKSIKLVDENDAIASASNKAKPDHNNNHSNSGNNSKKRNSNSKKHSKKSKRRKFNW